MTKQIWLNFVGALIFILLWQMVSVLSFVNPILFPSFWEVFKTLFISSISATLLYEGLQTVLRAIIGFTLGTLIGIILGLVLGLSKRFYKFFEFPIDFSRSLPASALLPVFILFFGIGDGSKILLVAFVCSLILIVSTIQGVRSINTTRTMAAQIEGVTKFQLLQKVIFPSALPSIAAGMRISISIAMIIVVVTEMLLSTAPGLGRRILDSQTLFRIPEMYAAIIFAGIFGYLLNKLISVVTERVVHWEGR